MENSTSHHITLEKHNLTNLVAYNDNEYVMLGNGQTMPIEHTRSKFFLPRTIFLYSRVATCSKTCQKSSIC